MSGARYIPWCVLTPQGYSFVRTMKPRKVSKVGQGHLGGAMGPDSVHTLLPRVEKVFGKTVGWSPWEDQEIDKDYG